MKDVLSVVTFVIGLCFVLFLITMKPDAASPITGKPSKPAHCKMLASRAPGCRSEPDWLQR